MKILITGSEGFLAKNLSIKLKKIGHQCYGIGRGKWKYRSKDYKRWGYIDNICNTIKGTSLLKYEKIKFDYVIHCAGGASPNTSLIKSITNNQDFEKNVKSIYAILDFLRSNNQKAKVIFVSSISVCGNVKVKKIKEDQKNLHPLSNYSLNKLMAEEICKIFNKIYKINFVILRGTSLYGIGLKRQIIYDVCKKIKEGKNFFHGTGNEIRDFIHVDDFVNLIICIINKGFTGLKIVNAGTGEGTKILNIVNYIKKKLKKNLKPKFNRFGSKVNPKKLVANIDKAKKFNWRPKIKLNQGIKEYVDWILNG